MIDINLLRRNLQAPRTGQSPAERANPLHHERLEEYAKWPERLMLVIVGAFVGAMIYHSL